ncbi:MAG TPA: DUF2200 domain-containing protein [Lachnospiraceae bacterium]|nr:DUF2200 domain-containing protein [Lachnospiraceae bacterium]
MTNERVYQMDFNKVYQLLVSKAVKKGRTKEEVDQVTGWLTGYSREELEGMAEKKISYGDFFRNAPQLNENRRLIKGVVCGVRVEDIEEPLMQEIRYLDKLVDELAKGKSMDKILRK